MFYGNPIIEGVSTNSDTSNAARINTIRVAQKSHTQQIKTLTDKYNKLNRLLNGNKIKNAIAANGTNEALLETLHRCCKSKSKNA